MIDERLMKISNKTSLFRNALKIIMKNFLCGFSVLNHILLYCNPSYYERMQIPHLNSDLANKYHLLGAN